MGIEGLLPELGSGKSAWLTGVLYRAYLKGRTIASNYHLMFPHQYISSVEDFYALNNVVFGGDEFWLWASSESGESEFNRLMKNILLMTRKNLVALWFTQQVDTLIMRKVREVVNEWVYTFVENQVGWLPSGHPAFESVTGIYQRTGLRLKFLFSEIGHLYSTAEVVSDLQKTPEFYKDRILQLRADEVYNSLRTDKMRLQHIINFWRMTERDAYYLIGLVESKLWM